MAFWSLRKGSVRIYARNIWAHWSRSARTWPASVTKSFVGTLAALLAHEGIIASRGTGDRLSARR